MKPLGEARSWAAGQDRLEIGWQVAGRLRNCLRYSKAGAVSQDSLIAGPGQVGAWWKRICACAGVWGLCDPPLLGKGSLFLLQGKNWGFVSSQLISALHPCPCTVKPWPLPFQCHAMFACRLPPLASNACLQHLIKTEHFCNSLLFQQVLSTKLVCIEPQSLFNHAQFGQLIVRSRI